MAFFSHCMLQMSLELIQDDPAHESSIAPYLERFLWIAGGMHSKGNAPDDLWDEEDGFFYDVLVPAQGQPHRLKIKSMVGLLPLMASTVFEEGTVKDFPLVVERVTQFTSRHPGLVEHIHPLGKPGVNGRRLLSIVNEDKLRRILTRMLDENQFLSPFGIRSLSREHEAQPFVYQAAGQEFKIDYQPAESLTGAFGGNSNWRGPIWAPVNVLLLRGLLNLHRYYGDGFKIECPTGSGKVMNLYQVACEVARRLESTFLSDATGQRPVNGGCSRFKDDPAWRDRVLFYEYFHGDTGKGLGASHQTGWTGLVAFVADFFERIQSEDLLGIVSDKEKSRPSTKPTGSKGSSREGLGAETAAGAGPSATRAQ